MTKIYAGIKAKRLCNRCGKVITVIRQYQTEDGYVYEAEDTEDRYIDRWGFARNYCKECMR